MIDQLKQALNAKPGVRDSLLAVLEDDAFVHWLRALAEVGGLPPRVGERFDSAVRLLKDGHVGPAVRVVQVQMDLIGERAKQMVLAGVRYGTDRTVPTAPIAHVAIPSAEQQIKKNVCACGCGAATNRDFKPGHDARLHSKLQRGEKPTTLIGKEYAKKWGF